MSTRQHARLADKLLNSYLELVRRFPLRVISTKAQYAQAVKIVNELMRRGDETLDAGEVDYLRVLGRLIGAYESEKFASRDAAPLEVLKFLMEQNDLRSSDLGELIGRSAASHVLQGHRELSKSHIATLAARFNVSPAVFFDIRRKKRSSRKVATPM